MLRCASPAQARAESEEVGRKPPGDGIVRVPSASSAAPSSASINFMLASGYTGQTTEVVDFEF